ncbi:phosphotransferase family protein [Streptomyces sp. NPDC102451]|uniref:phosphotransferase family protein n=1 Tax=Streptomyces sp. NPDC102451 TaxID=3366177 RepID=UPI003809573E
MTVDVQSEVYRAAADRAGLEYGDRAIEGPLRGHHHETYVIPLPPGNTLGAVSRRGKVRERRPGLFGYDRRCFRSEEPLLAALQGRVQRIPEIIEVAPGVLLQGFVEGRTLGRGVLPSRPLSPRHGDQLGQLLAEMAAIKSGEIDVEQICHAEDLAEEGDCAGFLDRLIHFTYERVYQEHGAPYHGLFEQLGVDGTALESMVERAGRLASRPFTLVHGDLHRANFIVDRRGDLWTIDWELALFGDPLYDLATHLHLMRYPERERERICRIWQSSVESARPDATAGWRQDLPVLLAYKQAQSVYTDVIRGALALEQQGGKLNWRKLPRVARRVQLALAGAQEVPGMPAAPTLRQVASAYAQWFGTRSRVTASAP